MTLRPDIMFMNEKNFNEILAWSKEEEKKEILWGRKRKKIITKKVWPNTKERLATGNVKTV